MKRRFPLLIGLLATALAGTPAATLAQGPTVANPPYTAEDWAAVGKLPDWTGLWLPNVPDQIAQMTTNPPPWNPVAAAKTVADFAKDHEKLVILGGAYNGSALDEAGVKSLANMPSLDQSRAKIVGLLQAPASQLLRLLQTPGGQVARVIAAHAKA